MHNTLISVVNQKTAATAGANRQEEEAAETLALELLRSGFTGEAGLAAGMASHPVNAASSEVISSGQRSQAA
jgi:hypothetical protein